MADLVEKWVAKIASRLDGSKREEIAAALREFANEYTCCRLRIKVLERDGEVWLAGQLMSNPLTGRGVGMFMRGDGTTMKVEMTVDQWNALPFHWVAVQEEAPRPKPEITIPRPPGRGLA